MKIKTAFAALLSSSILLYAGDTYTIKYNGITLGEIENINTIQKLYLNAKATNPFVRIILGKSRYVFYDGQKPKITDAKFRRDKNKLLFALREAINHHPKHRVFTIKGDRKLVVSCKERLCRYQYYKHNQFKDSGIIEFDQNNTFYKLTEKNANVVIQRKK